MNVENINFAQFLDYFTTWYPILVPSALLSIIILGCIVDRIRVVLVGYIDDYESDVKTWWWPKIKSLTGSDVYVVFGPILPIIYLTGMLLVIKLLPWVIVVGIAIGYFTLKLTRSVVRLTKKFKSHVSDPNAHKGMNDED